MAADIINAAANALGESTKVEGSRIIAEGKGVLVQLVDDQATRTADTSLSISSVVTPGSTRVSTKSITFLVIWQAFLIFLTPYRVLEGTDGRANTSGG